MAITFTIPTTTLPVGETIAGPTAAAPSTDANITVNRTGSGTHPWLNTLTSASVLNITIQSSPDGTTWVNEVSTLPDGFVGGTVPDPKTGQPRTTDFLTVSGMAPGTTQARAVCDVAGPSSITISGTITTQ